jgi:hypothetical protein
MTSLVLFIRSFEGSGMPSGCFCLIARVRRRKVVVQLKVQHDTALHTDLKRSRFRMTMRVIIMMNAGKQGVNVEECLFIVIQSTS